MLLNVTRYRQYTRRNEKMNSTNMYNCTIRISMQCTTCYSEIGSIASFNAVSSNWSENFLKWNSIDNKTIDWLLRRLGYSAASAMDAINEQTDVDWQIIQCSLWISRINLTLNDHCSEEYAD